MLLRIANKEDIPSLCHILNILFTQEQEFVSDYETQAKGLKQIISNNERGEIFVAEKSDEIMGMVVMLYTISTALGTEVAILEDMVVIPEARSTGLGGQLIEYAMSHVQNRGCARVTLFTDSNNYSAHKFYEKHGFHQSTMLPFRKHFITPTQHG